MATLEWLTLAQENVRSIIEEFDEELLAPFDFMTLMDILDVLEVIDGRAKDKFRNFLEDMTEEMS